MPRSQLKVVVADAGTRCDSDVLFPEWMIFPGATSPPALSSWCVVRASSIESLGTLFEPLQTMIDFDVRILLDQPINDL